MAFFRVLTNGVFYQYYDVKCGLKTVQEQSAGANRCLKTPVEKMNINLVRVQLNFSVSEESLKRNVETQKKSESIFQTDDVSIYFSLSAQSVYDVGYCFGYFAINFPSFYTTHKTLSSSSS